jgi:ribosomal protein S7
MEKNRQRLKYFMMQLTLLSLKQDAEKPSLEIWKDALTNVMPHVEVRSRRVGGATQIQCKFVQTEKFLWQ